jgi:hypothetical protein
MLLRFACRNLDIKRYFNTSSIFPTPNKLVRKAQAFTPEMSGNFILFSAAS